MLKEPTATRLNLSKTVAKEYQMNPSKHFFLVLFALCIGAIQTAAYNNLHVLDPEYSWNTYSANIEEATISVKPKGLFSEIGLYLTISDKNNYYYYNQPEQLEIVANFDLPKEAIVTDLWLWVGDDIVRGKIMDKWTASSIYEGIVQRKRDPSIIFKRSETQYELRIYPLFPNETRRIKLTYLVPNKVVANNLVTSIPMKDFFQRSRYPLNQVKLVIQPTEEFNAPALSSEQEIERRTDKTYGDYYGVTVSPQNIPDVIFANSVKDGYFLSTFSDPKSGENYYQLAIQPDLGKEENLARRLLFLLDYNESNTTLSKEEFLYKTSQIISSTLTEKDNYNIVLSGLTPHILSDKWIQAKSEQSDSLLQTVPQSNLSINSNYFSSTLTKGIEFIREENATDIILISANNSYTDHKTANTLIKDVTTVLNSIDSDISINILDIANTNRKYEYINGRSWYNNEYLYTNLAKKTKGVYRTLKATGDFTPECNNLLVETGSILTNFSVKSKLNSGWTFGEYAFGINSDVISQHGMYTEVGKFQGEGEFQIGTYYKHNNQYKKQKININPTKMVATDSTLSQYWTGHYIAELEKDANSNSLINEIIEVSMANRVLSLFTSFLCLEPSDTVPVCVDCFDENELETSIAKNIMQKEGLTITSLGEGFKINLNLPASFKGNKLNITIFNLKGQVLRTITTNSIKNGTLNFQWDGKGQNGSALSSGLYIMSISGSGFAKSQKIQIVR